MGIILNEYLEYGITAKTLAGAAGRSLGGIITKFNTYRNVGFKTFSKLYDSGVVPVLEYCAGVWGNNNLECCDKIQQRALRYYLGVHQKTPILALEGDTGWKKCQNRRLILMCKLWNRIVCMEESRLTRKIFDHEYKLCSNNWCEEIKLLLTKYGQQYAFNHKTKCDIDRIENGLENLYKEEWKNSILLKPKLRTYILFKDNYDTEDYVKYCLPRLQRSLLAQIRCGVLPLHIEIGRFRGLKPEERLCILCIMRKIEDEFHFVCECTAYLNMREELYRCVQAKNEHFTNMDNKDKFVWLMKNEWKLLAKYLEKAWNERSKLIYNENV